MDQKEKAAKLQVARQCAPVLAGIKISNLLILSRVSPLTVMRMMDGTGLSFDYLYCGCSRKVWLVYWLEELEAVLQKPEVRIFLREFGYQEFSCSSVLMHLKKRYQAYLRNEEGYPHELGVLLDYPLADVKGFMENKGQNYLYSGYWKVYSNAEQAKKIFARYGEARRTAVQLAQEGKGFREITGSIIKWREPAAVI